VEVQELAAGLWRWTAPHPAWKPEDGGPGGWERDVGCVYYEGPGAVVLIDPLAPPPPDAERFWTALDRDVETAGRPVAVLLTVHWHRRSADDVLRRYRDPGATLWTRTSGGTMPAGVEPFEAERGEEALFWLPGPRALVAGDVLIGAGDGTVRTCPTSWLSRDGEDLRESLRPLLELPIELLLVSHGEPVLTRGREALAEALETPAWGD
jgi:glyoxylase-like metal-dependent hydrolase (beta-lactamase superfamily II)